jgi:hypothetical protein
VLRVVVCFISRHFQEIYPQPFACIVVSPIVSKLAPDVLNVTMLTTLHMYRSHVRRYIISLHRHCSWLYTNYTNKCNKSGLSSNLYDHCIITVCMYM